LADQYYSVFEFKLSSRVWRRLLDASIWYNWRFARGTNRRIIRTTYVVTLLGPKRIIREVLRL